jgi:hypothetical protein
MTDLAGQQFHSGDSVRASETLKGCNSMQRRSTKASPTTARSSKDAELLMQRTSFRLKDILDEASFEDRGALEATLMQLNQVQAQLMTQVFKQ